MERKVPKYENYKFVKYVLGTQEIESEPYFI